MFSIRVHLANDPGHSVYECKSYDVRPDGTGAIVISMRGSDGEAERQVAVRNGGLAYVMGDAGKTVEVVRSQAPAAPLKVTR